jgi:serine protease
MLDAGAAVAAAAGVLARIQVQTPAPAVGSPVSLSGVGSLASIGSSVTAWSWQLVSSEAGVASGFTSATDASTATLTPTAAGRFTVELRVTDSSGASQASQVTVSVAAAGGPPPVAQPSDGGDGGGGGGGAVTAGWMGGLLLAVLALMPGRRR